MTEVKYKVLIKNGLETVIVSSLKSAQELVARYGGSFTTIYSKEQPKFIKRKGSALKWTDWEILGYVGF